MITVIFGATTTTRELYMVYLVNRTDWNKDEWELGRMPTLANHCSHRQKGGSRWGGQWSQGT